MKKVTLAIEDIGLAEITMGPAVVTLDIVQVNNRLAEIQAACKDKPAAEYHQAQADYIQELGFPPPSHFMVLAFGKTICELQKALELELKNVGSGGLKHDSPGSTVSTPSAGASGQSS